MDTYVLKASDIKPKWYVVDANGQILGRVATKVASVLRGKHKVTFAPNLDNGDYVIIINADKVKVTGKKLDQKVYFHHTGWIGGAKFETLKDALNKHPERVLEHAVKVCYQRDLSDERCIKNFSSMLVKITHTLHKSQKCLQ